MHAYIHTYIKSEYVHLSHRIIIIIIIMCLLRLLLAVVGALLLYSVASQEWMPCDVIPLTGCSCMDPERPLVECHGLGLKDVPAFGENMSEIHTLKLTANNIRVIKSSAFAELTDLRRLSLEGNHIKFLRKDCFKGVHLGLSWLDLRDNDLIVVPEEINVLKNVKKLYLSGNLISILHSNDFVGLSKLEELYLDRNPILNVSPPTFSNAANSLLSLTISLDRSLGFNEIGRSSALSNLESLSISGSKSPLLRNVKAWLTGLKSLRHLELRNVNMTQKCLTRNSFGMFKYRLESLSLRDNLLQEVPMRVIKGLTKLQMLDLSGNQIGTFTSRRSMRRLYGQLRRLGLSNNTLSRIDQGVWTSLPNCATIDIRNNQLQWTNLTTAIVERRMAPYVVLEVGGNPWVCNCRTLWLRELIDRQLRTGSGHLLLWEIYHTIRCHHPGPHANQLLKDVPMSVFSCSMAPTGNSLQDLLPDDRYFDDLSNIWRRKYDIHKNI